jgi:8-oxo-dGTP diphosphatase
LAGEWEFPGGKVEAGEEGREALAREIGEELACEVEVGEELAAVEHRYPEVAIRLRPFVCTVAGGEPQALEHEEIAWFAAGEIASLALAAADREVWRALVVHQD